MTNARSFILKALLPLGAMLALAACIDPIVIGGNGNGGNGGSNSGACMVNADCAAGQTCTNGVCSGGGMMTCNGMPSPLSCTQTGCAAGQTCVPDPDPSHCYPSSCGCDAATGTWVCTADCGQGSHCVVPQACNPNGVCPPGQMCDASGMCVAVCTPSPETCNGVDDDCDGAIDEQNDPAAPLCMNGAACVMGQCGGNLPCTTNADCSQGQVCQNGVCVGGPTCTPEMCNGIDDDCNGVVDDGSGAVCADGTVCTNGQCGGVVQCGPNSPPCPPGQVCTPNGVCSGGCVPSPEICNGIDDNCNGVVDEATPGTILCPNNAMCVNGSCGGVVPCSPNNPCPAGQVCSPNGVCSPGGCVPKPETCNGLDDDCDGVADDATPGTTLCSNGAMCVNGSCGSVVQCGPNNPCPVGQFCSATGVCTQQCSSNANCPAGQVCQNGLCK